MFKTKIYHPNIDEKGQICIPIILAENWKPATKAEQGFLIFLCFIYLVIQSLVALVNDPEPDQAVRTDVAHEFLRDKQRYLKNAYEWCKLYALPRN